MLFTMFLTLPHLQDGARLDKVSIQKVVKDGIQFFFHILNEQRPTQGK